MCMVYGYGVFTWCMVYDVCGAGCMVHGVCVCAWHMGMVYLHGAWVWYMCMVYGYGVFYCTLHHQAPKKEAATKVQAVYRGRLAREVSWAVACVCVCVCVGGGEMPVKRVQMADVS